MHKKLLIPGPTEVSKEILNEQTQYLIGHREKEFSTYTAESPIKSPNIFQLPADLQTNRHHWFRNIVV